MFAFGNEIALLIHKIVHGNHFSSMLLINKETSKVRGSRNKTIAKYCGHTAARFILHSFPGIIYMSPFQKTKRYVQKT